MDSRTLFTVSETDRCVKVSGEVDSLTAPELLDAVLTSALCELDLSEVSFMDFQRPSRTHTTTCRARRISNRGISRAVQRLLDMTAMSEYLLGKHGNSAA